MEPSVEFWSSVEYGTFLKGLVRELGGGDLAAAVEGGQETANRKPGTGNRLRNGGTSASDDPTSDSIPSRGAAARQRFTVTEQAYRQAKGTMARLGMRWRCYVDYPLQLRRRVRREGAPLALVVCTNTFYAPWVAMRSARRRGIPVVHWMFDLFPDVLILAGKVRPGSLAERLLRHWVRAMFDGAAANVFLGERLLAYAEAKFGPIPRAVVIPVGCDAEAFADKEPKGRRLEDVGPPPAGVPSESGGGPDTRSDPTISVLYCGNFGRMHDVDTLVGALAGGMPAGVQLAFRGNGAGFQVLGAAVRELGLGERVSLGGSLPEAEWLTAMAAADVALVTMKPGAEGIVMPSKTYSAMAAGQAILAVCPRESDLADTVLKHDCGWVVEPGDVAGLRAVLESLPVRSREVLEKRRNAWRAASECYDQKVLAVRWRDLLADVSRATKPMEGCSRPR